MKGVIRTRVGYAGGSTQDPTYRNIGDHSEAIQIDYDPQQISYQELLRIFWGSHYPSSPTSGQYRSAIFYHSAEQQQAAQENKGQEENRSGQKMYTEIEAFQEFYLAEDYHQKYTLRNREQFFYEYNILFPEILDFVNSTATARVNGYLAGHGTLEMLQEEFGLLGLSEQAQKELLDIVRRNSQ
ncbi:MAG: peptide-methionine (S)-S-oxide reductase [bacterium]|nr:peptide-methionine (S)-S-oxide reductase [bacterium]